MTHRPTRSLSASLLAALLVVTPALVAQTEETRTSGTVLRDGVPETYVVVRGDTLWDISARFLRDPWLWPDIWQVNPEIPNPHLIYPGDIIRLIWVDGKPRLIVDRGTRSDKLEPQIRSMPSDQAIPSIPMDVIRPFINRPQVIGRKELDRAPYLLRSIDGRLMSGDAQRVYVRGLGEDPELDWTVVRKGQAYRDPETKDVIGYEAEYIADASVVRLGDPSTVVLVSSRQEALAGDRLIRPVGHEFDAWLQPRVPAGEVQGQIIARLGGGEQIGQYHIVIINRGRDHGMEPGVVLSIWKAGEQMRDTVAKRRFFGLGGGRNVQLPDERGGEMIVFRTAENLSYALVMRATRDLARGDFVRNP